MAANEDPAPAATGGDVSTNIPGSAAGDTEGSVSGVISASPDITRSTADDTDSSASSDVTSAGSGAAGSADSTALRQPPQPWGSEDWLACSGENAAISEVDHGMSRQQAEALAFKYCVSKWLYEHPVRSDADDGCPVCGAPDQPNDPLLAVELGGGLVWAHRECAPAWRAGRLAAAIAALAGWGSPHRRCHPPRGRRPPNEAEVEDAATARPGGLRRVKSAPAANRRRQTEAAKR